MVDKACLVLTVQASVIRLHMRFLDSTVLDHQRITLTTIPAKDSSTVEGEIQCFGELQVRVGEEADLSNCCQ